MRKIMACLDIGTDTIKCVVGEMVKKKLNILAVSETPSNGMVDGLVSDANLLIEPLQSVIKQCEEVVGLPIRQAIVSVPAHDAYYNIVSGFINIDNDGFLIEGKDVIKASQQAIKKGRIEGMEYISMMPTSFSLDDDRVVRDPKGLTSKTVGVRGVMVSTPKRNIYPILACLEKIGIEVLDIILSSIGDYYEFKDKELDKNIGAIVNIGAATTTISIFNKGVLTNSNVISVGSDNVDKDISFIYKISNRDSRYLKEKFALAHRDNAQSSEIMELQNNNNDIININQFEVSEVVMSRVVEILNLCKKDINHLTKKEISYIIFTGGLTECKDFKLVLNEEFGSSSILGSIKEIGVRNNKFSTCIGLIKYYAYMQQLKDRDFSIYTIDEQQELSGSNTDLEEESMIGKLFGYIFQ